MNELQDELDGLDGLDGLSGLTLSEWFEVLADEQRRTVLAVLGERDGPVGLDALARAVTARAATAEPGDDQAATTPRVAVTLHHHHLPKLAEVGLIEYDATTRTVTVGAARTVDPIE